MKYLDIAEGYEEKLPARGGRPKSRHVYCKRSIEAINAAMAARRPLLVRGEPGVGKSQLARAAAVTLRRALVTFVVDLHTEPRDLLYRYDAVKRLGQAQVSALAEDADLSELAEGHFISPGPLWWAFDWPEAHPQLRDVQVPVVPHDECSHGNGCVVLIDEIDKADSSVPNGLLEALGEGRFTVPGLSPVSLHGGPAPLVIVTTNEERRLPNAFLRRCVVLRLEVDDKDVEGWLQRRGETHFKGLSKAARARAAKLTADDRRFALTNDLSPPGLAEYLDLLRAVDDLATPEQDADALVERLSEFVLRKHDVDWPPRSDVEGRDPGS